MKISKLVSLLLCASALTAPGLVVAATFTDDFNRANTTAGNIGSDWTVYNDGFFINNNSVLTQTTGTNMAILNDHTLTTSFDVSVDILAQSGGRYGGIVFNYNDSDNYYVFRANYNSSGTTAWQFLKVEDGTQSVLDDGTVNVGGSGMNVNTWYTFNIASTETAGTYSYNIVDTSSGTVYAQGTISDSTFALGGQSGFYFAGSFGRADNYSLTTVPEPQASALLVGLLGAAMLVYRFRMKR